MQAGPALALAEPEPVEVVAPRSPAVRYQGDPIVIGGPVGAAYGSVATGLVIADFFPGTPTPEILVAAGNDVTPQPLLLFENHRGTSRGFDDAHTWVSGRVGYHHKLCAGDIDGDARIDFAVAIAFGLDHRCDGGGVDVYVQEPDGGFAREPSHSIVGWPVLGCAFGDVDGDGDLDLAFASAGEPPRGTLCNPPPRQAVPAGRVRIFANEAGRLGADPAWVSDPLALVGDVQFSDVDADGHLDLAVAGSAAAVFFADPDGRPYPTAPQWRSRETPGALGLSLDIGELDGARPRELVLTRDSFAAGTGALDIYSPRRNEDAATPRASRHDAGALPSHVRIAEVDGVPGLDVVVTQWRGGAVAAPLVVFGGRNDDVPDLTRPWFQSHASFVGQAVRVVDLGADDRCARRHTFADATGPALTLPQRDVADIRCVLADGSPTPYAWSPERSELSVPAAAPGVAITVHYTTHEDADIVVADWEPSAPLRMFRDPSPRRGCPAANNQATECRNQRETNHDAQRDARKTD